MMLKIFGVVAQDEAEAVSKLSAVWQWLSAVERRREYRERERELEREVELYENSLRRGNIFTRSRI